MQEEDEKDIYFLKKAKVLPKRVKVGKTEPLSEQNKDTAMKAQGLINIKL